MPVSAPRRPADRTPREGLLFPGANKAGSVALVTNVNKALDYVAEQAGWKKGEVRSKMFRHTSCSARLHTLDGGAPVSEYTVGRELGHGGAALVRRIYGHLGRFRHRSDVVEYRVSQHLDKLAPRLAAVGLVTDPVAVRQFTPEAQAVKLLSLQ